MKKADQFIFPTAFTGTYPTSWAGYIFLQWTAQGAFHPGIDWNWGAGEQDFGNPVQCIANGQVIHQSRRDGIGYGIIVVVKHELTDELRVFVEDRYNIQTKVLYSFYAHLKDEIVNDGQELERGELLGYVGKSGTKASHLHGELYKPIPGTQWRYWPTLAENWNKDRLKEYYIDSYDFVVTQPKPDQTDWAGKFEACRLDLDRRDAEKRFYEEIARATAGLLETGVKKDEIEKAIKEIFNGQEIGKDLWKEVELKIGRQYRYPDAKQAVLEAVRSLSVGSTVPVEPTPVFNEKFLKEYTFLDTLIIRIYKKINRG